MRLKFIACKYTVFIPFCISARNIFFLFLNERTELVRHFRDELDTYQTYFFIGEIIT